MADEKIRILQLIYSFDVEGSGGGIARFVIALCEAMDKDKFEVAICGLWNLGSDNEQARIGSLTDEGIKAFTAADWEANQPMLSLLHSYRGLSEYVDEFPVDIIHSHSEFSDIVALMLKFHPSSPVIMRTIHNGYPLEWRKRPFRRLVLTNLLYPLSYDAEIGVAEHVVRNLNKRWLARQLKREGKVLRNSIDLNRFSDIHHLKNKSESGLGLPDDAYVIGTIGRLRVEKGYEYLLEAASLLIKQISDPFYIVIVGAGDLADSLKDSAKKLQIDERVIFTGPRQDIELLLNAMDLFVCSSLWEGFSTAVLEAMAAGLPVIATDIPGNRELIEPGVSGWMVPPGDPVALSKAIQEVMSTPEEQRKVIAEAGKDAVLEYSIEKVARQHESFYKKLLKEKRG